MKTLLFLSNEFLKMDFSLKSSVANIPFEISFKSSKLDDLKIIFCKWERKFSLLNNAKFTIQTALVPA